MTFEMQEFIAAPEIVKAVQINPENIREMAHWCGGTVKDSGTFELDSPNDKLYIDLISTNLEFQSRRVMVFYGDWIVVYETQHGSRTEVFRDKDFKKKFIPSWGGSQSPNDLRRAAGLPPYKNVESQARTTTFVRLAMIELQSVYKFTMSEEELTNIAFKAGEKIDKLYRDTFSSGNTDNRIGKYRFDVTHELIRGAMLFARNPAFSAEDGDRFAKDTAQKIANLYR